MKFEINVDDKYFDEEALVNTPHRVKTFYSSWFNNDETEFKFTVFPNIGYNEMITWEGKGWSLCMHHLLPIEVESIVISYIPDKYYCGLSKLQRAFEHFARRPQVQEKLTMELINFLQEKLNPLGCAVLIKAKHACCAMRGVKTDGVMKTSAFKGVYLNPPENKNPREELLKMLDW